MVPLRHVVIVQAETTGVSLMKGSTDDRGWDWEGFWEHMLVPAHHLIKSFRSGAIWTSGARGGVRSIWSPHHVAIVILMSFITDRCVGNGGQDLCHIRLSNIYVTTMQYTVSDFQSIWGLMSTCQVISRPVWAACDVCPEVLPIIPFRRPCDSIILRSQEPYYQNPNQA